MKGNSSEHRDTELAGSRAKQSGWSWSLTAIMLLATVIRLIGLSTQSFTMDECFERDRTEMTIPDVIHDPNSFPPLYHLLLKVWLAVDNSEMALRTFSVICGLLALWSLWWIVRRAINEDVAWWALLIGACSPFHVLYSQEGRVYMLYLLLALLAVGFLLRWARDGSAWDRAGFVTVAVVGGYVHYFFAIVLVTLGLIAFYAFGFRFVFRRLLPVAIVIGVLCSPLLLLVKNDLTYQLSLHAPRPLNAASAGYTYFSLASGYTLGVSRAELHTITSREAVRRTVPWAIAMGAVIVPLLLLGTWHLRKHWTLAIWLGLLTVPVILLVSFCVLFGLTYNTRFLIWLWIPYCVLLAAGFCRIQGPRLRIAMFCPLAIFSGLAIYNRHAVPAYVNEDVRSAAAFMLEDPQRPVLVCSAYMLRPLQAYLGGRMQALALGPSKADISVDAATMEEYRHRPIWLMYSREFHGDPSGELLEFYTGSRNPTPALVAAGVRVFKCDPLDRGPKLDPDRTEAYNPLSHLKTEEGS